MAETVDIWDWTGTDVKVLRCRVELTGVSVVMAQQTENAIEPITATVEVEVPLIVVKDKGFIYRGMVKNDGLLMINAKAPYGSLETEAVWTVSTSTLSPIGEVISTTMAENQIWSNYNN